MGFFDTFKGNKFKNELSDLQKKYDELKEMLPPDIQNIYELKQSLEQTILEKQNIIKSLEESIDKKEKEETKLEKILDLKKKSIVTIDDEIVVQEFGLYKPRYGFANSLEYKEKLDEVRKSQKEMIKSKNAVNGSTTWTVNGSKSQGVKMVNDIQKLLLRAFNSECDEIIGKVKYTNFDASQKKIINSSSTITKLGTCMSISISNKYLELKLEELTLAFEYQQKKHEEKELQKQARIEMREAAKLQKEIEEQRKKIEKEQTHYQTAYEKLLKQLENNADNSDLLNKKIELEKQLKEIEKSISDIDYREANQRAGYVYIISNIGAFGENIYKIGMTRRLNPQDRIDELGDASVPFNFDVHAMIFSDDAPALETALHKAFEDRKLNMVNTRREFFNVTLDEIKEVVKNNFDKTVEFIDVPDAEQYRISQKMKHL